MLEVLGTIALIILGDDMKLLNEWPNKGTETLHLLNKIQNTIHLIDPNADIVLYGSRVRGEAHKDSDWDFLILIDKPINIKLEEKLRDDLYEIELDTDQILSSIIRTKEEWNSPKYSVLPFKRSIEREGVLL